MDRRSLNFFSVQDTEDKVRGSRGTWEREIPPSGPGSRKGLWGWMSSWRYYFRRVSPYFDSLFFTKMSWFLVQGDQKQSKTKTRLTVQSLTLGRFDLKETSVRMLRTVLPRMDKNGRNMRVDKVRFPNFFLLFIRMYEGELRIHMLLFPWGSLSKGSVWDKLWFCPQNYLWNERLIFRESRVKGISYLVERVDLLQSPYRLRGSRWLSPLSRCRPLKSREESEVLSEDEYDDGSTVINKFSLS